MLPGEKLYEDLLIDAESKPTQHPLILRAKELYLAPHLLWSLISRISNTVDAQRMRLSLSLLSEIVPEWQQSCEAHGCLYPDSSE